MRGTKQKKNGKTCDPQSATWMGLTLISFPLVALIGSVSGFNPFVNFGLGALSSVIILAIEGITRKRFWFFDPCVKEWIEHPHLTFRLLSFLGIVMLLFLSFLTAGFLFNSSLDENIIRFILNRQCSDPSTVWISNICTVPENEPEQTVDPVAAAIRTEAARRYYPESTLVTCAQKTIQQKRDEVTVTRSALIRCDRWMVGRLIRKPVSLQSTYALVMTRLLVQQDGSYVVQEWSDDPTSEQWISIGEEIATSTLLAYNKGADLDNLKQSLADETAQRANLFFSRER